MTLAKQSSEFLPVACPHPLCPSKPSPSLQALSLISGPKGQGQVLTGGLGVPPFTACVLPSCKTLGISHQALAFLFKGGDLSALPSCHGEVR